MPVHDHRHIEAGGMKYLLSLILILALPVLCLAPIDKQSQIINYIETACKMLDVDTDRVLVRAFDESSFRNVIVYEKKTKHYSYGALQISLATARIRHPKITAVQLKNPWTNIYCGIEHIKDLENSYCGDWRQVVSCYLTGHPNKKYKLFKYEQRKADYLKAYNLRKEGRT